MLSDEVIDKVVERLAVRMEQANEYVLQEIGKSIKKIGTLSPSKAQQLIQIIRYGGDYQKIVKKIKEITKLNIKDIEKIFKEVAKNDYDFAKQFYDYKKKKYIPWDENKQLQEQIKALAKITAKEYVNMTKTMAFATYENGKIKYTKISKMYQKVLDEAVLNVGQGKETFDNEMYRILKQLGESGIRVIDYPSGRSIRADSAVRMQMKGALRNMHNEIQQQFGEEFDADGVEISVHLNPAPDHQFAQGKQFSLKEFEKFQNDEDARSYDGILFPAISEEIGHDRRAISQYNCYHYVFSIVLGVSEPQYSNEELQEIIDKNNKGFELDGKHYTNYQGTQLQRQLETEIRKQKDAQILARASGNDRLIYESQERITQLTNKYRELSKTSGLPTSMERMRVSGYQKVSTTYGKSIQRNTINMINFRKNNDKKVSYINRINLVDEKKLNLEIEKYRRSIIGDKIENAYLIDRNGDVFFIKGTKYNVKIPDWLEQKDSIIIHNHVEGITHYGFSKGDVKEFIEKEAKKIYGDDLSFSYIMERGNKINKEYLSSLNKDWNIYEKEAFALNENKKIKIEVDEYDYIVSMLSKKYGFKYHRKQQQIALKK